MDHEGYIGGILKRIDREEAERNIQIAFVNDWFIALSHVRNGLGPRAVFDFYKLEIKAPNCPSDKWEISKTDRDYFEEKYPEDINIY